jgi:hypothetical protein
MRTIPLLVAAAIALAPVPTAFADPDPVLGDIGGSLRQEWEQTIAQCKKMPTDDVQKCIDSQKKAGAQMQSDFDNCMAQNPGDKDEAMKMSCGSDPGFTWLWMNLHS